MRDRHASVYQQAEALLHRFFLTFIRGPQIDQPLVSLLANGTVK